jgi:hypothetical protein
MWELRRNGVASEPISEADLEAMLAAGTVEGAMPVRPVGKDAWKPALRHAPFASAASRAPRREGSTLMSKSSSVSPPPPKDPVRWDQQTQLNMPVQQLGVGLPTPLPPPPLQQATSRASAPPHGEAHGQAPLRQADAPHPLVTVESAPPLVRAAGAPTAGPTAAAGFPGGLFDFSFTTFVTTRVVKTLYVLFVVFVSLVALGGVSVGFATVLAGSAAQSDVALALGLAQIVGAPVGALVVITLGRIAFESIVVFFRVAEHLAEINRKTVG